MQNRVRAHFLSGVYSLEEEAGNAHTHKHKMTTSDSHPRLHPPRHTHTCTHTTFQYRGDIVGRMTTSVEPLKRH